MEAANQGWPQAFKRQATASRLANTDQSRQRRPYIAKVSRPPISRGVVVGLRAAHGTRQAMLSVAVVFEPLPDSPTGYTWTTLRHPVTVLVWQTARAFAQLLEPPPG